MSEGEHLLSRIKNRNTPKKVSPRETGFVVEKTDSEIEEDKQQQIREEDSIVTVPVKEKTQNKENDEEQENEFPVLGKRRLVRLEESIQEEVLSRCREEEVTLEIFLEAAYLIIKESPQLERQIFELAKERLEKRKWASMCKRARTLSQKYL